MSLDAEFRLSLYEELKLLHKSRKGEIFLVQNIQDEKIYIKKEIKEYTKEIYENISKIDSINMPKIYDLFELNDKLIVIEEFINGDTLQSILEKENKLEEKEVIKYMISLCDILDEIHNLNPPIIHRDIKPANIIISSDNVLKLIDFDIARTYKDGENMDTTLLGTKGYASPEQFGFDQTDCRSDIYAIGVMMNVLTTGKHIKEELNNTLLKDIIKKCTNISADERYQNVFELKEVLESKLYCNNNIKLNNVNVVDENIDFNKYAIDSNLKSNNINESNYIKRNSDNKSLLKKIPGFRRTKIINMILASLLYLFLIFALFIAQSFTEFIENIVMIIMILSMFFILTNFLNIKEKLPIIKSKNKSISILGYFIYMNIIFFVCGGILTLLQ